MDLKLNSQVKGSTSYRKIFVGNTPKLSSPSHLFFLNVFLSRAGTRLNALLNQHSCHSAGRVVSKLQEYPFHLKLEIYI